ncbi:hypothetical protein L195_g040308, partial [Trifolium pratense]
RCTPSPYAGSAPGDEGYDFAENVGIGGMTKEEESDNFYNYRSEELNKTPISSSDDEEVDGPKKLCSLDSAKWQSLVFYVLR